MKNSYKRILKISDDHKQITLPDSRFYRRNGEYYPSITHVLSCYPKGQPYEDWLRKVGFASDYIVKKAAEEGTQVHILCEEYLKGEECSFLNSKGHPQYPPHVWSMFLNFVNFWETIKPELIETEVHLFSDRLKIAGTCDLIVNINGELWVLDLKTSNHLHNAYNLQTACYAECYFECFGKMPTRRGVLWLKSRSRGEDKKGKKLKGKNWEVVESERNQQEDINVFMNVKALFDLENPLPKPYVLTLKTTVKREV